MKALIIGGGLSGICLAHQFIDKHIDFKIIDDNQNYSTKIAGGMINPMTFRRMIKTWRGDELIPVLKEVYTSIEKRIGEKFFFPINIRRAFSTEHERLLWEGCTDDEAYSAYVNPIEKPENTPAYYHNPFGNAIVNSPGYIEAEIFMDANHRYFMAHHLLRYEKVNYADIDAENLSYKGEKYTHIIFAEGARAEKNPFFNYLPFKNAKGEILTIGPNIFRKDEILNRKCFLLPTQTENYRLGSTYTWGTSDPSITQEAKDEILENYKDLCTVPITVIDHKAGIRPVASDRRPFIGEHPTKKGLYIFNAMGAKGFMIAPYFSIHFVKYLLGETQLDKEVNIFRYSENYFTQNAE
ncbi:MAG: FAD-binding oxidoreductase [Brumimicrobium sp.]|nr:FAD-binding oxidoreductase [Brumimicrobium sp.]